MGGEAQDLVLGHVLGPLVVAVQVRQVGDVVLVRRLPGLRLPQSQGPDGRRVDDALHPGLGSGTDDVAAASDVYGVEGRGVLRPEAELGGEVEAESRAVKDAVEIAGIGDVGFAALDLEAVEVR